jgi:integrase
LPFWGEKTVGSITAKSCRAFVGTKAKMGAQADLKTLKAAVDYWNKEYGPLTVVPTYWRPKDNPPKQRWLTKSEAAWLLRAAKPYPYLRRAILLQLYTGSRPGVVQAISVGSNRFRIRRYLPRFAWGAAGREETLAAGETWQPD